MRHGRTMGRRITLTLTTIAVAFVASTFLTAAPVAAAARPVATTTDAYCDVTFTIYSQWSTGYSAGITIRNVSQVPVRWRLALRFVAPVLGFQVWNSTATMTGSVLTIVPNPGYDVIQPGQSVVVGFFTASGNGTTPPQPTVTCAPV